MRPLYHFHFNIWTMNNVCACACVCVCRCVTHTTALSSNYLQLTKSTAVYSTFHHLLVRSISRNCCALSLWITQWPFVVPAIKQHNSVCHCSINADICRQQFQCFMCSLIEHGERLMFMSLHIFYMWLRWKKIVCCVCCSVYVRVAHAQHIATVTRVYRLRMRNAHFSCANRCDENQIESDRRQFGISEDSTNSNLCQSTHCILIRNLPTTSNWLPPMPSSIMKICMSSGWRGFFMNQNKSGKLNHVWMDGRHRMQPSVYWLENQPTGTCAEW